MKILIIRFSAIGDIVWTNVLIRCIQKQIPSAEIHFVTKSVFESLVLHHPFVKKVWTLTDSLNKLVSELKSQNFDFVLDVHNNFRSHYLVWRLSKPFGRIKKYYLSEWLLVHCKINLLPKLHVAQRMVQAAHKIGVYWDGQGVDFYIPKSFEVDVEGQFSLKPKTYVVVIAGSSKQTKRLTSQKLFELLNQISQPVILVGGMTDKPYVDVAISKLTSKKLATVYNACGMFSILQSASIIEQAACVIGHDTGLTHIASAFHTKIYTVWGNTTPDFGMYPFGVENIFIQNEKLSCRPCSKIGFDTCPRGHFACIEQLTFNAWENM